MNELLQPEFAVLTENAPEAVRPAVAGLMDLIDEYEHGDFSRGLSDVLDPSFHAQMPVVMWVPLMRIYRYANELVRAELYKHQSGSTKEGT